MSDSRVTALRSLLASRFPERARTSAGVVSTACAALDDAMGGGLPLGRVSEWVAAAPSSGTQLALWQLVCALRAQNQRLALVDAAEVFAPEELPEGCREHLVWVRCRGIEPALGAADLLLHDGNFRLVVLDVREVATRSLQAVAATLWYRLQRTVEETGTAFLACTPVPLVPSAAVRLSFHSPSLPLGARLQPSADLLAGLAPERVRGRNADAAPERLARTA
ncbi:hypothetical protein [Nibricoccus sp. IMCC34717]|uniref:hypothetical protein n=1 Tax=Nibricoccus sp. IMCC34717 TaxID=3034021 RepID=UPI00384F6FAE